MADLQSAFERVNNFAERWIKHLNIPGLSIAVTDRQNLLWESDIGLADVTTQAPNTVSKLFEIGSLGKPLTNIALLQLRDEGKLDLQAPVAQYLPWFQVQSTFPPITAHHLMSQTAGIVQGTDLAPYGLYEAWALHQTSAGAPPGELCSYSNVGYKVLGFLLERLTGQSFPEAIQSRVLTPLGMTSSYPATTFETRKISATGHCYQYDDRPEHPSYTLVPAIWSEYGTADGCQVSTAGDMTAYLRLLLNRGQGPSGQVISELSFNLLVQHVIWTGNDYYGYGLASYTLDGHDLIAHGGRTAGYMSGVVVDLESGLGVVTLANRTGEPDVVLQLATYALSVARAARDDAEIPAHPVIPDPSVISNAAEYAGAFRSGSKVLQLADEGENLILKYNGWATPLERRAPDSFYVGHPDFDLFLLDFKREGGKAVEVFHGGDWFVKDAYSGPREFSCLPEWTAYCGHYRTRNPQMSNFRVVLRKGTLALIYPSGAGEPLIPLKDGRFRIGEDERLPDSLRFDGVIGGRALRVDYCGCPYYRAFTP